MTRSSPHEQLTRTLGTGSAVMMGLGSIIGTGVFVSIGIAAGIAGPAVILAIALAAIVAACNGLSSAQLAANRPVSGGTYEYAYHYTRPALGFTAGWMFLFAKSASAATAALGFSGYLIQSLGLPERLLVPVAVTTSLLLTGIVLSGLRRSNWTNITIVSVTLIALLYFVAGGLASVAANPAPARANLSPFFPGSFADGLDPISSLLNATALMFVAFTGYGRIATLGEEVHNPRATIPRAIIITMIVVALLYIAVGFAAVSSVGADTLGNVARGEAAPLQVAARAIGLPALSTIIAVGAMTAMVGVLLNLILGLSRVLLAMGRRGDMPSTTTLLNAARTTPVVATITVGLVVTALTLVGDVRTTWSFSAFTVLIYYAITNLSALRLSREERLYRPLVAWIGLGSCVFLAFWVDMHIWLIGLGVIAVGLLWHAAARRLLGSPG